MAVVRDIVFLRGAFGHSVLGELWAQKKQIGCKVILEKLDFKLEGKMIVFEPCKNSCNVDTVGVWPWPYFTDENVKTQRGLWSNHGGNFPSSLVLRPHLSMQGVQVPSLAGELRCQKPEHKQLNQYCNKFNKDNKMAYINKKEKWPQSTCNILTAGLRFQLTSSFVS